MRKIISGGQTGVDRGALDAAMSFGFECGGWCPAGRLAEDGIIPVKYPLNELSSEYYQDRTLQNVIDSDGTVIIHFAGIEGGTKLTLQYAERHQKLHLVIDGGVIDEKLAAKKIFAFTKGVATK